MKVKVFALTLVATLLFGVAITTTNAAAKKNSDKASSSTETTADVAKPEDANEDTQNEATGKEVHKRGIFYNGGAFASHGGHASAYWPKTYASHYGYNLNLPGASPFGGLAAVPSFAPSLLKYHQPGFHYKAAHAFASPALTSYRSLPSFPTLGAATIPHAHAHVVPQAVSHAVPHTHAATPFVIRPGGAVVSSYSVNYPQYHQKPALAVQHVQPVQPIQSVAHITPVQHFQPPQPITPVQHFHTQVQAIQPVQPVQSVAHVTPVQHFQPPQPITPVQHFHTVQPIQTVQSFQPVQPVVQVQQPQPIQPVQHLHPLHHYFQTSFVQPQHPIPAVPAIPAAPAFPAIPSFPSTPAFPDFPAFPALPALPSLPTIPTTPTVPTVQAPPNSFFPIGVQPPRPQQPPTFVSIPIQPAIGTQFPGVFPRPGRPAASAPDSGSAEASPQIPPEPLAPRPAPIPEPEFPSVQQPPQPTQQPWRPVLNRPSNTLLPPYGSAPAEGYLPPVSQSLRQQQESSSNVFDNLSDAEIEHIFAQANFAAQREQQHQHHRDYHHHY